MKKKNYTLLILAFFIFNLPVYAQNNTLNFDGSNDYVNISNINLNGLSNLTFETWVSPESFNPQAGDNYISNLLGYENADALLRIGDEDPSSLVSNNRAQFVITTSSGNKKCNANTEMIANTWYHLAGTYDGANMRIYVNGKLESTQAHSGGIQTSQTAVIIGSQTNLARSLDGSLDEIKIWSLTKTESEIRQGLYAELQGNEAGLLAYYKFNEPSGTTADNAEGTSSYDGTLNNMAGTEWTTSSAFFGPKKCYYFNGIEGAGGSYVSLPSTLYNDNFSAQTAITIEYWYRGNDLQSPVRFQDFAGLGDYVIAGWGGTNPKFVISTDGGAGNGVDIGTDALLEDDSWHHIACTWEKNTTNGFKTYVDGVLSNQRNSANVNLPSINQNGLLGAYHGPFETMQGELDEVRIWSDVRNIEEIRENMNRTLVGDEPGLVAYYNFDIGNALPNIVSANYDGAPANITWQTSTPPTFNTWLNTDDSGGSTASNWSTGSVPISTDNVGIYNLSGSDPIVSNNFDCKNFFLETDASFTMNSGTSFFTTSNQFINGNFTIKKDIAQGSKWHIISAPNNNTTTSNFTGYYLQGWSEDTSGWYQISELDQAMPPVKGYSLFDIPAKTTLSFTGIPNTGEQTYSITYTDSDGSSDGMNLIGNPYPSAIDLNVIDPSYGAFHVWDPSTNDYEEYNGGTGNIRYLAPLQGFFVYSSSNETFTIDNNTRTHTGAGTFYKSSKSGIENGIVLSTNQQDKLYIKLMNEASDEFDFDYDAFKIISLGENNSQLYSKYFETKLAIDCRPETETIQLGYQNNKNGTYTIELGEGDEIVAELEDTKLNMFHDLHTGAYSFDWQTTDSEERFLLHLKATGLSEKVNQEVLIYTSNKLLYARIDAAEDYNNIHLYDLTGRLINEYVLKNESLQTFDVSNLNGAYLVKLVGGGKTITKKVVLRK